MPTLDEMRNSQSLPTPPSPPPEDPRTWWPREGGSGGPRQGLGQGYQASRGVSHGFKEPPHGPAPQLQFSPESLSRAPYSNKLEVEPGLYLEESERDDLRLNQAESTWEVRLEGPSLSHWTCPDDAPRCPESPHWGFVRDRRRDPQPACTPGHQRCFSFEGSYRVSTTLL